MDEEIIAPNNIIEMIEEPIEEEIMETAEPETPTPPVQSVPTFTLGDRIAEYLGIIFSLFIMTSLAGVAFAFFFTFIPSINFTLLHVIKCWVGVLAALLTRGILKAKF